MSSVTCHLLAQHLRCIIIKNWGTHSAILGGNAPWPLGGIDAPGGGSRIWRGEVRPFPSPPFPFPPISFPSPFPSPFLSLPRHYPFPPLRSRTPWLQLGGLGERYRPKLPQRVRAEPGRQMLSGAFSAWAHFGKHFQATCP